MDDLLGLKREIQISQRKCQRDSISLIEDESTIALTSDLAARVNDVFLRFIYMLRATEAVGANQVIDLLENNLNRGDLGRYFGYVTKEKRGTGRKQLFEVEKMLEGVIVDSYCQKFNFIERHLLKQQHIVKIAVGGTIDFDELFGQPKEQPTEFILNK